MTVRNTKFTIKSGEYESNIVNLPPDIFISTLFIPDNIVGSNLLFLGDVGDGVMRQLNFIFDLTSTAPYYKSQIVTDLASKFTGLARLQLSTSDSDLQTEDITIIAGYTY